MYSPHETKLPSLKIYNLFWEVPYSESWLVQARKTHNMDRPNFVVLRQIGGSRMSWLYSQVFNAQMQKYKYTNTNICIWQYMSVEFLYWYWIYFANNFGIYINWRVSVIGDSPIGNVHFLEYFIRIFLEKANSPTLRPPQKPSNWHISPNFFRIYQIAIYKFNWHIYHNCLQIQIQIQIYMIQGPNLPGANLDGAQFAGAQFAGAQFAGKTANL